jgi:hypothetical protein
MNGYHALRLSSTRSGDVISLSLNCLLSASRPAATHGNSTPSSSDLGAVCHKSPPHTPMAVVNQVVRLYRIEQVSQFLESALERISDGRDSA